MPNRAASRRRDGTHRRTQEHRRTGRLRRHPAARTHACRSCCASRDSIRQHYACRVSARDHVRRQRRRPNRAGRQGCRTAPRRPCRRRG
ncbi:hypothetical protein DEJ24_02290 [Curtobacterium sp. MCPF17_001]|nr:hypothetical protein DEJ24_02290 [Curtobacterium sp. MCPF17_001]